MHSWWLSWKHLVHKPATLTLNLVLLALSTGLIAAVMLFNRMLTERLDRNLAGVDMVIGAKGSPLQLILAGMYHIDVPTGNISLREAGNFLREDHPLIALSVPLSLGDSYKGYRIVGTDQRFLELYALRVAAGATFREPMEVLAGAQVARVLGLKVGDTFQSVHGLDDNEDLTHEDSHPFRISGILEPSGSVADQLLLCSTESVWMVHEEHDHDHDEEHEHDHDEEHGHEHDHDEEHGHEHDHDHAHDHADAHDHAHGPEHQEEAQEATEEALDQDREITSVLVRFKVRNHLTLNLPRNINENTSMQAAAPAIELNRLYSLIGSGEAMLRALALIIMIVAGLSIFVSLYSSLRSRRYELALMRAMGSSPTGLFRLILQEGLFLSLLGGLLGLIAAHTGVWLAGRVLEREWNYAFDAWIFLPEEGWLLLAVLLFGLIASLIPAWQARQVDIADTLTGR